MSKKEYVKPRVVAIKRSGETEALYELEDERNEALKACAREWMGVRGVGEGEFWTVAVPQALFDVLDSFDTQAAELAAQAYLEMTDALRLREGA